MWNNHLVFEVDFKRICLMPCKLPAHLIRPPAICAMSPSARQCLSHSTGWRSTWRGLVISILATVFVN
jgi:hypothetical protein